MVEIVFILGFISAAVLAYVAHKKKWKIADFF